MERTVREAYSLTICDNKDHRECPTGIIVSDPESNKRMNYAGN